MSHHILFCNEEADVLVIDLPTSISRAQASTQQLRSTVALENPHLTPEPKGTKKDVLLSKIPAAEKEYHDGIASFVQNALGLIHQAWQTSSWCLPRKYLEDDSALPKSHCLEHPLGSESRNACPPLVLSSSINSICCFSTLTDTVVHNPNTCSTTVAISTQGQFIIPACSTFLNASVEHGREAFESAVHCLTPGLLFDLVLLDPPWANRSVRNSRVYLSMEDQTSDPFGQIIPKITTYLSDNGYVAVWITNKAAVRSQVVQACNALNLVLEEEWIWLKVTNKGEPVTFLEGLWRKPYEILLVFRRNSKCSKPVRRIGIAVPDVHSRKPSLKSMFEQLLPKKYNALEVFARSLTTGWWSWGDEVLKFQHESNWC